MEVFFTVNSQSDSMFSDKRLLTIFLLVFSNLLGAGVIFPLLPLYAEGEFGATEFQAALLATAYFAAQFVASPYLGRLSDRYGRRPVLIGSQFGTFLSFGLFIVAIPIGRWLDSIGFDAGISGGLLMLYIARVIDGITGGNITAAQAYATDVSKPENRAEAIGVISAGLSAGIVFGPAFGGFLVTINPTAPFIGAAAIIGATLILTFFTLEESLPPEKRELVDQNQRSGLFSNSKVNLLQDNTVKLIMIIGFVTLLAFSSLTSTFALFADRILFEPTISDQIVARNVGLMLSAFGVAGVLTQAFAIRPMIQRFGEQTTVVLGQFVNAVGLLFIGLANNAWVATIFFFPFSFGRGITDPSLQSILTRYGTPQTQGRLLGIYQSSISLGFIVGPIIAGIVFGEISPRAPYLLGAALMGVGVLLSAVLARAVLPQSEETPADKPDVPAPVPGK